MSIDGSPPFGPAKIIGKTGYWENRPNKISGIKQSFEKRPLGPYRGYKLDRPDENVEPGTHGGNGALRKPRSLIYNPYDPTEEPPYIYKLQSTQKYDYSINNSNY